MSPVIFGCIVCGYQIDGYPTSVSESWLKEFRAIYSCPQGTFISGVGQYDDPRGAEWIAPPDPAKRWDDRDYLLQASDRIPVMEQVPENGKHGFILHNACWRLLQKALEPDSIPTERLLAVCRSLPFPLRGLGVCWAHDYGGLTYFDNRDHYPWEDLFRGEHSRSEIYQYAHANPYDVPEVPALLKTSLKSQPLLISKAHEGDCFSKLPWEIREAIAIELPTEDALNLRRASAEFFFILTSQTFWASRFEAGGDRDFVFEERSKRERRDWFTLYRVTSHACKLPGLKNRRRVWGLIRALVNLLRLRLNNTLENPRINLGADGLKWSEVAGDIKEETGSGRSRGFDEGCRLFQKQSATIPSDLSRIALSTTAAGNVAYIVGMRLITSDGADVRLGYMAENNELFFEVTAVKGFVLAMGPRGLRALQVIGGDGRVSKWLGCPEESPVTERLAGFESIGALEVGVDGYKIVSLAVAEPKLLRVPRPVARGPSLRATALWYPTAPSLDLCLNDDSFTGESPSTAGYQPLFWTRFGGPGGIYLGSLIEVCVTRFGGLCGIEFHYNTEEIPTEAHKLGRRKLNDFSHVTRFPIDGPGGELIQTVHVSIERAAGENAYRFCKHGKLGSLKPLISRLTGVMQITTNRGRSVHFQPQASSPDTTTLIPLSIAPGTTLTGFYASQHPEFGLISLGAMSEVILNGGD